MIRWCLALTITLVIATSVFAVAPQAAQREFYPAQVQSREINPGSISLSLNIEEPTWTILEAGDNPLQILEYTNGGAIENDGYPIVPMTGRMFRVPPRSGIVIEVISAEFETYSDIEYAAFYQNELDDDYGPIVNNRDEWFPGSLAEATEPALFHDFRVSTLALFPVQVNPASHDVRVYSNIQVQIRFEGIDNRNALEAMPTKISEAFLPWYRQFLDWDDSELDQYTLYRGHVQVVIRNNAVLMDLMAPWFEWKRQKGWVLDLLTDADVQWTNAAIRNELIARYEDADPKFDYVVIVGDDTGAFPVPASTGAGWGHGDHQYATLAGGDQLIDVSVGRISVENNTEVLTYVNKVLTYERSPNINNTAWYLKGMCNVSSNHSGIGTVFMCRYHRHAMLAIGYTQVDTAWVPPWGNGNTNTIAINSINAGVSFYSARGYAGTGLQIGSINALVNDNKTPIVVDLTCYTGNWSQDLGINEAYMRAGTPQVARGGIGAIGNATGGTNPRFNNSLGGGAGYAVLVLRNPCLGDMHVGAKLNIWNNFNGFATWELANFNQWDNLMGDPTVYLWTGIPQLLTVEAQDQIDVGINSYSVTVEDDGDPVVGAWVTLYKVDDDEEIIARGITDGQGFVTLDCSIRYAGDAVLTVSKQHYAPYRLVVEVVEPHDLIGYDSFEIVDNGANGTVGDNDRIPEAGETVGLIITAKNFGDNAAPNVNATASSEEPWISSITGTIDYGALAAGASSEGEGMILVAISPESQHDWILHLTVEFTSGDQTYPDQLPVTVRAPQFAFISLNGVAGFDPGETTNITVQVRNVGGSAAAASTAVLHSLHPTLSIINGTATFASMAIGQSRTSTQFRISSHSTAIPGNSARAMMVITTANGQMDSTFFSIPIGTRRTNDPVGPDRYGYYAFDNTDTGYDLAPIYDWIEVNPNAPQNDYNGTLLNIQDVMDDGDMAVVINLPFTVQYYGARFNQATVTSNGMMAMGSQADMPNSRNWTIPAPLGPNYMIAPYWDERFIARDANSGVYTYWDQPRGRFIVEWYNARDYQNSNPCTFEVIFYTQAAHPTYTGDNEFVFQYSTMTHTQGSSGSSDTYYWTTGIENGNQTDGLQLAYWNLLSPGVDSITNGRAILFSSNVALITGTVEGDVTDDATGLPIQSAQVATRDNVFATETDANGHYLLEEVIIWDDHYIVASAIGYNSQTFGPIEVIEDETTEVNFSLTHPEFHIDTDELTIQLPPDAEMTNTVTISNSGNGDLEYAFRVLFSDPGMMGRGQPNMPGELDERWDEITTFALSPDESRNRGVTFMENSIWVAGSFNADPGYNKLYRYNKQGVLLGVYDQPVANHSSAGFLDITTDDQYLYGSDRQRIYKMEFSGDNIILVDTWNAPINIVRYITYDRDRDVLWLGHPDEALYAVDMNGQIVTTLNQPDNIQAIGYHPDDPTGFNIYAICQYTGELDYNLLKIDPENGDAVEEYAFPTPGYPVGADLANIYNPLVWTFVAVMDGGGQDYLKIWEIDLNSRWIDITPETAVIPPDSEQEIDITVYTTAMQPDTYNAWLEIDHNSIEQRFIIPLEIEVLGGVDHPHFNPVNPTGRPYAIIVNEALFNDEPMTWGDEIGIFDGNLCVGAEMVNNQLPLPIITWQSGQELPGFAFGNPITIRVWSLADEADVVANVTYIMGNGTFGFGPMSQVSITATNQIPQFRIPLQANYFELVSTYLVPEQLNAAIVFGNVFDLAIVYEDDGSIYIPPIINTIGNITITEGYQLFCRSASEWVVEGEMVDPEIVYSLASARWNWLGYPFDYPLAATVALTPIVNHIVIVQNDAGGFWIPNLVNTLGNMQPATGYFVFVNQPTTFHYNPGGLLAHDEDAEILELPTVEGAPAPTGLPYIVLVYLDETLRSYESAALELYDGSLLIGKSAILADQPMTPVVAWGGSAEYDLVGFTAGHPIRLVVKDANGETIPVKVEGAPALFGDDAFASLTLKREQLPIEFSVQQGYPNPFNPTVTIPFALPTAGEVTLSFFNLLGQEIYRTTRTFDAGYHRFVFDASQSGANLVSGMYFLQIQFNGQVDIQKIMLLK